MKITFLCSDKEHPINIYLENWTKDKSHLYDIELVRTKRELSGGDFLFLISCSEIISLEDREKYVYSLVLHASDLPNGRGWSPHIWAIVEGKKQITLTLLEAEDKVDTGRIWTQKLIDIPKTDLWDDINDKLFKKEIELIELAIENHNKILPIEQDEEMGPTYYRKRTKVDSEVNIKETLESQFDKIRVCDPNRYPAYFHINGQKYKIVLEKLDD